jgi:hypothetical protein
MNDDRVRNPFVPWYGTENMETDEPIITHCGKTVEPIRMLGGSNEKLELRRPEEVAEQLKGSISRARTVSQILKVANARRDWSNYEI